MSTPDRSQLAGLLAQLAAALSEQPPEPEPERPMPPRVLLTVEEAAEQLGIGRTTAWRLVRTGDLATVQIGRLRRVPASSISDFAARLIAGQTAA